MALKVKGGMWCEYCQRPVAGQKSTQKVVKLTAAALTGYVPTPGDYICPTCGTAVKPLPRSEPNWPVLAGVAVGVLIFVLSGIVWAVRAISG